MTDRVLQAVTITDPMSGSDDVLSMDLTGTSLRRAFIDLGSTNQYFKMVVPGFGTFPNDWGMRFYLLYEDENNHVRMEPTAHDHSTYNSGSYGFYIVKGGVERYVGGAINSGTSGLLTCYASADSDYFAMDPHTFFFGFGGSGAYIHSLDGGGFFGNGNGWPDVEDLPHGTMIGWDLGDFYDYWASQGRDYGDPTAQPWVDVGDGSGNLTSGSPTAKSLVPTPLSSGWIPAINDPWPASMSIWCHRDNAIRRVPLSYNPGSTEPLNFVRDGALVRDMGAKTGRMGIRSRGAISAGWQAWYYGNSGDDSFPYQEADNGGTYPIPGSFGTSSNIHYTPEALLEFDVYFDRRLSQLRAGLDFWVTRYFGGDYRPFYGNQMPTDEQFLAEGVGDFRFWLVYDIYIDGVHVHAPYYFIDPTKPTGSALVDPAEVGTEMYVASGSGDIETDGEDYLFGFEAGGYYDLSFAPYFYGPFAYMIVTDRLDYPSWEAHCIFDGHYSQLVTPLMESTDVVRYRFESNKVVTLADGSTTTVQDGTNPIAEWRLKPANGFGPNETWSVTLTVWNVDGLSDSVTADVPLGGGAPNIVVGSSRSDVRFYPYGPRPVA